MTASLGAFLKAMLDPETLPNESRVQPEIDNDGQWVLGPSITITEDAE